VDDQILHAQRWLFQLGKRIKFFYRERILLLLVPILYNSAATAQENTDQVKLNQVGYYPNSPKLAVITGRMRIQNFYIVSADGKDTLYEGSIDNEKKSAYSSAITRLADFSSFKKPGNYVLRISDQQSFPFEIKNDVYAELGKAVLKSFYYQRSSIPLEDAYAGKWRRTAKHSGDVVIVRPSVFSDDRGTIISSPGGWYDKGDFNKCIVSSGMTMSTLLSAYEDFSKYFDTLNTKIPESNDRVPDILNETLYNLRWMFTMQDPFDGGVYHKCSNVEAGDKIKSRQTETPETVQKSTAAALDFAAVMAQAGRIFRHMRIQLPGLADSCLRASANAWFWALKHPDVEYEQGSMDKKFKRVAVINVNDGQLEDEWMWAATEMFVTSKNRIYFDVIEQNIDDSVSLPSMNNVRMLAYYSMLRYKDDLPGYAADIIKIMEGRLVKIADDYLVHISSNAFATVMGQSKNDFVWGSNSVAANQAILLINAYLVTSDQKYVYGSIANLDYLLGRNATGYCFVTGCFGIKSPMHPYYQISETTEIGEPVPGLLVGGPNQDRGDKCHYPSTDTETSYMDSDQAYSSNSISIDWNASVVYLVNAMEAMQYQLGFSQKERTESYASSSGSNE
jgi:endoglucanase